MARRPGRQRNELPACYYEGYLEKRSFKDKTSRKLWTCLCGNSLFFFNEKRDLDYVEKLDLSGFVSISDDSSQDRNLDAARLNLMMKEENIKLTAPNAEARELWKGFIHSVAQLSVPSYLNLLPGQLHMLKEAVETEKERIKSSTNKDDSSTYVSPQAEMPACYHSVSRLEAELLLEREASRGNLLLRPGRNGNTFAITTRQAHDGINPVLKHYRVTRKPEGGFKIDLEKPVSCATLQDVIYYLVENTGGVLTPLIIEEPYEKSISYIRSDKESGEMSVQEATFNIAPPSLPPKPAFRLPTPEPAVVEGRYYDIAEQTEKDPDSSAAPLSQKDKKALKMAIMPPTVPSRKLAATTSPPATNTYVNKEQRMRTLTDPLGQIPLAAITELKLKLEKKAKSQEEPALV